MKLVGLIPMRGGSKSIPLKNIQCIAGKPLFYWSTKAAIDSKIFHSIFVSTDSHEIKTRVKECFPDQIQVVDRPTELATDTASTEAVMLDFIRSRECDALGLIQVTNPFTTVDDFRVAYQNFVSEGYDSLVTVSEFKRFLWNRKSEPLNYNPKSRPRRQDFEGALIENGAFYFTKRETLISEKSRLARRIGHHVMCDEASFEIDEPYDWLIVEALLQRKKVLPKLSQIRCVAIDVDGTLTDGGMYYSTNGEELKKFNTVDAQGIASLRAHNFEVCVITAEDSPSVTARMKKLKIENYFKGAKNKVATLETWMKEKDLSWSQIAYIGDDIGDLGCMQKSGVSFCPNDAQPEIQRIADYRLQNPGGKGAVREMCDLLLASSS